MTASAESRNPSTPEWRRWLFVAAGASLAAAVAAAPDEAAPARTAVEARIPQIFADYARPGQPGCSVGVMRDGALVHSSAYGLADIAGRKPLDAGSVFNIASVSKQFTAFSILLLEQRQALSIDDPLIEHIPELAASARGVTLRHLIHHTGGLRDYESLLMLRGRRISDGATQFETIQTLSRQQAANSPPGAQYSYSNSGYVLLATVVERVSGRSMRQFTAENIFVPLGMADTTIVDRYPAGLPKLARGYSPARNSPGKSGFDIDESAWEQVGDGQVHTTVADLLRWTENFRTGRAGGLELMQRMVETGALDSGQRLDYAAGLGIGERNGLPSVSHGGGWAGYRSELLFFPQQRFAVSVLCNRGDANPDALAAAVADLYLAQEMHKSGKVSPLSKAADEEEDQAPVTRWKPANLADYEGVYWSEEAEARCLLMQRNGQLVIEGCAAGATLQPTNDGEFYAADMQARLRFGTQAGKAPGFTLHNFGLNGLAFERQ